jgi:YDG domain/MBG domain (YGX type)
MRTRLMRGKFLVLFMTFGILLAIPAIAFAQDLTGSTTPVPGSTLPAPTIQSDKEDYAPGDLVTLTGSGWQPGESVNIVVNDDAGQTWNRNVNVVADASGNITDQFNLPDWFVAAYSVKATGASGAVAMTTFTDGQLRAVASNLSSTQQWTLTSTRYSSNDCTGIPAGGGGSQTLSGTTQSGNLTGSANSVKLQASNPSATGGKGFGNWTWTNTNNPANTVTGSDTNTSTCVDSGKLAANDLIYTANYVTPAATTLAVDAASGTYGGTTDLKAKLTKTSDSTNVSGKTITFSLRGTAVCDNLPNDATKPDCPTTDTNGEATLTGVSLSGINAGGPTGTGYAGAVTASFAGDTSFGASNGSNNLTVSKKNLTVSGLSAQDKPYDGTTNATITGTGSLVGKVGTDNVSLSGTPSGSFADASVGPNKAVTVSGLSLTGTASGNYALTQPTLSASITAKNLTINGAVANNREYNGGTDATVNFTNATLVGKVGTDAVTINSSNYSASFADKNVGANKAVTVTGVALSGAAAGNYTLTQPSNLTANITAKALTGSFTASNKEYDGTRAATVASKSLPGVIGTDEVTLNVSNAQFDTASAGTNKNVTGDLSLTGAQAGNYSLSSNTATTTANITPKELTVSATGVNKTYDGNSDATVTLSTDELTGDDVTANYTSASFANKNVGTGKAVSVNGISVTGTDAGNYTFNTTASTTATIAQRPITVTAEAKSKLFGEPDPPLTYQVSSGPLVSGESFTGLLSRVPGELVGQYNITLGTVHVSDGNNGDNYFITYNGAKLTIGAWTFNGFFQPVDMNGVYNTVKGGSTVPLKFKLFKGTTELTDTAKITSLQATKVTCVSGATIDDIETLAAGNTMLRYDSTGGQFIYNWKTPTGANTCHKVTVTAQDNSTITAYFKMK